MKSGTKGFFLGVLVTLVVFIAAIRANGTRNLFINLINLEVIGGNKAIH